MALTAVDKVKINKYLAQHSMDDIYYLDMCDALGKRGKILDVEFLEYFTDSILNGFRKDDKLSSKNVSKLVAVVGSFVEWMNDEKQTIGEDILDKIRSFKELYDDYLNRTSFENDEDISNYIDGVLKVVNKLYPTEVKNESVTKYINKVDELQRQIKKLEKEIIDASKKYNSLQSSYKEKCDKADDLREQVNSLEKDVRSKTREISSLSETIESLNNRISELSTSLSGVQDENSELAPYKEKYELLLEEVETLKDTINNEREKQEKLDNLQEKYSLIENLLYEKLLFERVDVDSLVEYIKAKGIATGNFEVANLLNKMKKTIKIDNSKFTTKPSYKIVKPKLNEDGQFDIEVPIGCKHYDIMLVSDFHIKEIDSKLLKGYDILTDYCVKNNISLILNLGDFFDGLSGQQISYENAKKNYQIIEEAINTLPGTDGVYHAILGGNHDKNIANYGLDPIELMADSRGDFINLGYTHSTINIGNSLNDIGCFDIHHPNGFDFPMKLDDNGIDIDEMNSYLSDIYAKQGRDRNDSYIDVFGHTHINQFNYPGGYCYIPSYFNGGSRRGASHLRIYFDEDVDIKYMVFMPLSYATGTRLDKTNEIIYQKIKK